MLYLMLVVIFSKLTNKWWFFLLLGYGKCFNNHVSTHSQVSHYTVGIPLFFVIVGLAARHDYYGVRGNNGELSL